MNFLTEVLAFLGSPISWIAAFVLGFLFHKEMRKLACGLLVFVVPGIGSLSASSGIYDGMARLIAVACLTPIVYLFLEQRLYRKAGHNPRA